jgi:hypothetical protein
MGACASTTPTLRVQAGRESAGHIDEATAVPLEDNGDSCGRTIAVLRDNQISLTSAGGLLLVDILTVKQNEHAERTPARPQPLASKQDGDQWAISTKRL